MSAASWGPFLPDLDPAERKARCRALRMAIKLLTGPRGKAAEFALHRAEVSGLDPDLLAEAEAAFDNLTALDKRRVWSSYMAVA